MEQDSGIQLTLFAGDFHASHFPLQESKKGTQMTVFYGRKCYELYGKYSRLGLLVKMFLESSEWNSTIFVLRWKTKVTKSNRLLFHLQASERGIKETGYGSLPTIRSSESGDYQYSNGDKTRPVTLTLTGKLKSIPTLKAQSANSPGKHGQGGMDVQTALATLTARAWKDTPGMNIQKGNRKRLDETGIQIGHETGLKLHPSFAEVMQGFPIGWTELKD